MSQVSATYATKGSVPSTAEIKAIARDEFSSVEIRTVGNMNSGYFGVQGSAIEAVGQTVAINGYTSVSIVAGARITLTAPSVTINGKSIT